MYEVGFGVLNLSFDDFWRFNLRQMKCAIKGHQNKRREDWEIARTISYYNIVPYAPKGFGFSQVTLPIDGADAERNARRLEGRRIILDRKSIRETYERAGFDVTEDFIDKTLKNHG